MLCMEQREELSVAPRLQVVGGARRTEIPLLRQETQMGAGNDRKFWGLWYFQDLPPKRPPWVNFPMP